MSVYYSVSVISNVEERRASRSVIFLLSNICSLSSQIGIVIEQVSRIILIFFSFFFSIYILKSSRKKKTEWHLPLSQNSFYRSSLCTLYFPFIFHCPFPFDRKTFSYRNRSWNLYTFHNMWTYILFHHIFFCHEVFFFRRQHNLLDAISLCRRLCFCTACFFFRFQSWLALFCYTGV